MSFERIKCYKVYNKWASTTKISNIVDYLYTHNINQLNQSFISIKYYFQYFLFFVVPPPDMANIQRYEGVKFSTTNLSLKKWPMLDSYTT